MYTHNYMFGDVLFLINLSIKLKMHLDGTHCSPVHNVLGCKHTAQWWCHTLILALSPWGHRCMGRNPRTPPLMGHKIPQKKNNVLFAQNHSNKKLQVNLCNYWNVLRFYIMTPLDLNESVPWLASLEHCDHPYSVICVLTLKVFTPVVVVGGTVGTLGALYPLLAWTLSGPLIAHLAWHSTMDVTCTRQTAQGVTVLQCVVTVTTSVTEPAFHMFLMEESAMLEDSTPKTFTCNLGCRFCLYLWCAM